MGSQVTDFQSHKGKKARKRIILLGINEHETGLVWDCLGQFTTHPVKIDLF